MASETNPTLWYSHFVRRVEAATDFHQRQFLFNEEISALPAGVARAAYRTIVETGWMSRGGGARLALETAASSTAARAWGEAHRRETFEAALAATDRLVSVLIGSDYLYADPAEQADVPVPSYRRDRVLTLGERKSLARRPDRRAIALALGDPHPSVIEMLLSNPKLTENDVVFIAARRPLPPSVPSVVGCHPKWRLSARTAFALINNPHTPLCISLSLLHTISRAQAVEARALESVPRPVREALFELLQLRGIEE